FQNKMAFAISQTSTSTFNKDQIDSDGVPVCTPTLTFEFPKNFSCYIKFKKVKGKIGFYCYVNSDKPINVGFICKINGKVYYNKNNLYEAGEDNWGKREAGTVDDLFLNDVMNVEWTVTLKSESNP
uniref:Uncharacterized protein n=1 Tax=Panagrolaimus sp. JU765 TaxID=591449 RepID=A0AC34R2J2_9BILA